MMQLGIAGDVELVLEQCARLLDAGVRHLSFGQPLGESPVAAIRLLGSRVLPELRERY
jgi:5,10-methylenetetrahydromethanopterin reductase